MSGTFEVYFSFSEGLSHSLKVPAGTKAAIMAHVLEVESTLRLKREKYETGPVHWDQGGRYRSDFAEISNEVLCKTAIEHNKWVRRLYRDFATWAEKPVEDGEEITNEDAQEFWHALTTIWVSPARWTREYYVDRMEYAYEVLRGRGAEGTSMGRTKALTPKQAAAVIWLFEQWLDQDDMRLDVPDGHDFLASSYDGGYDWCEKCCKAKVYEDGVNCQRKKCPLANWDEAEAA